MAPRLVEEAQGMGTPEPRLATRLRNKEQGMAVDKITKANRKVAKALAAFKSAHDTLAAVEVDLTSEAAGVESQVVSVKQSADAQIEAIRTATATQVDSLVSYRDSVLQSQANAAQVRAKLAEFLV